MNVLLLLTALLSALTGVSAGARAPQAAIAVARSVEAVDAVPDAGRGVSARPASALPYIKVFAFITGEVWLLAPFAPAFLSRRRE